MERHNIHLFRWLDRKFAGEIRISLHDMLIKV